MMYNQTKTLRYQAARRHNGFTRLHAHLDGDIESVQVGTTCSRALFCCPLVTLAQRAKPLQHPDCE